jgi:hypothetical protein
MRTVFGGTLSHKRGLITGVSAIALAAAMSMAAPSGALAANCEIAQGNNIVDDGAPGPTDSGINNGPTGACNNNNVVGNTSLNDNISSPGVIAAFGPNAGVNGNVVNGNNSGNGNSASALGQSASGFNNNIINGNRQQQ